MTTSIDDAHRRQMQIDRFGTFHCCPTCSRTLSIIEIIERHCERCDAPTQPLEVKEKAA